MGKVMQAIDEELSRWITSQRMFFVASAPSGDGGHINCSPKDTASLRILGPTSVAWVDLTGSGVETVAHLRDNGRIVLMFCAFEGAPQIVRLHGRGEVLRPDHAEFAGLLQRFERRELGVRSIIRVECTRIGTSCGFGVPLFDFAGERDILATWADKKGPDGVEQYWRDRNAESLDGLPGV
ncbi:MAG: pyridoxamine 5'-phosphate oxidase family protein [Planctomycetota bacterium]